jgi:UDP:flavonoid glycosyltransferase YjiC (YdhE family)
MHHGRKIFAYVYSSYPHFGKLMEALKAIDATVLVHSPNIASRLVTQYTSANIEFCEQPVDQSYFVEQSDLVICHSGHGTVSAALLGGTPLLLLPLHLEQMLVAKNVEAIGAGLHQLPEVKKPNFKKPMKALLTECSFTAAAKAFSQQYASFSADKRNLAIADRCEALINRE